MSTEICRHIFFALYGRQRSKKTKPNTNTFEEKRNIYLSAIQMERKRESFVQICDVNAPLTSFTGEKAEFLLENRTSVKLNF